MSKAGFSPSLRHFSRICVSVPYTLGAFGPLRAGEMQLWAEFGLRVGRRVAAHVYDRDNGYLPASRGWAARSSKLSAASPLLEKHQSKFPWEKHMGILLEGP